MTGFPTLTQISTLFAPTGGSKLHAVSHRGPMGPTAIASARRRWSRRGPRRRRYRRNVRKFGSRPGRMGYPRLSITDDFCSGDQFRIYDEGVPIGDTSVPTISGCTSAVGPAAAFDDHAGVAGVSFSMRVPMRSPLKRSSTHSSAAGDISKWIRPR